MDVTFKYGITVGASAALIISNLKYLSKGKWGLLPLIIQITAPIAFFFWYMSLITDGEIRNTYMLISAIFDILTKFMVVYFLSFRVLVLGNLLEGRKLVWSCVFFFGIVSIISGNLNGILVDPEHQTTLNIVYYSIEPFLSVIEIYSAYAYLMVKYHLKSFQELKTTLINLKLLPMAAGVFSFATLSIILFLINISYPLYDPDLLLNAAIQIIKYNYACEFTFKLFQKTLGANNVNTATKSIKKGSEMNIVRIASTNSIA